MLELKSGWLGAIEIVEVVYDPRKVTWARLAEQARDNKAACHAFYADDAQKKIAVKLYGEAAHPRRGKIRYVEDTRYYLKRTPLAHVPLTPLQITRLNVAPDRHAKWLSPRQEKRLALVKGHPKLAWPKLADDDSIAAEAKFRRFVASALESGSIEKIPD